MSQIGPKDERDTEFWLEIYKLHVEEVRFQTKFNSDRAQYLLILNIGILSVAATLMKDTDAPLAPAITLLVGFFVSVFSVITLRTGRSYYRRTVLQKARIELLLGLHGVKSGVIEPFDAVTASTPGKEKVALMLNKPEEYLGRELIRPWQISWCLQLIFVMFGLLSAAGFIALLFVILTNDFPKIIIGNG